MNPYLSFVSDLPSPTGLLNDVPCPSPYSYLNLHHNSKPRRRRYLELWRAEQVIQKHILQAFSATYKVLCPTHLAVHLA